MTGKRRRGEENRVTNRIAGISESIDVNKLVWDELTKKANIEWVKSELHSIREIQRASIKAQDETKRKVSNVPKPAQVGSIKEQQRELREELSAIRKSVQGWSSSFRRIVIEVFIFVIAVGGAAIWQYSSINERAVAAHKSIEEISEIIKDIQLTQSHLEKKFELILLAKTKKE